jgi:hypothetical protein
MTDVRGTEMTSQGKARRYVRVQWPDEQGNESGKASAALKILCKDHGNAEDLLDNWFGEYRQTWRD